MKPEADSQWPRWPQGTAGTSVINLLLASSVDSLLQVFFGPRSAFTLKCQEVHGNKDYLETGWEPSIEEAKSALPNGRSKASQLKPQAFQDRFRMTSCSGTSMGIKFKTEELQRVTVCQPGKQYEIEACVATTATYGDRFRCICRYKLVAQEKELTRLTIAFTLIFVKPVNFVIKKAIENGANSGISKNFEDMARVLATFVDVQGAKSSPAVTVPEAPQTPAGNAMGGWGPVFSHLQDSMASLVEPSLVWALRGLGRPQNPSPATLRAAGVIGVALLYLLLSLLLACMSRLERHCRTSRGLAFRMCAWSLHAAGLPSSARQLAMGCLLLVFIHTAVLWTACQVRLLAQHYQASRAARAAGNSEPETPQRGVRFEGYAEALETANAAMSGQPGEPPAASPAADAPDVLRLKDWAKLWNPDFWFPAKQKSETKGRDPSPAPSKAPSLSLPSDVDAAGPSSMHAEAATPQESNQSRNSGKVGYSNLLSPTFLGRTKDMMSSLGLGPAMKPEEASPRAPTVNGFEILPKAQSPQKVPTPQSEAPTATLADKPAAPTPAEEIPAAPPGPLETDVLSLGPVVEEVFENERLSAFLIWGHSWPGHFLPTDRVGHWSKRDGAPGGKESMSFSNVAPSLPEGWKWEDDDWHVDMAGASETAVDADGWSYAVDFPWLRLPPMPGSGRQRKMQHFVRRRRWVRVRQPIGNRSAGLGGELSKLGAEAEAMAVPTPPTTSPTDVTVPIPAADMPPLEAVRLPAPNVARHSHAELPDPPSPTMLSEAAARSRSKATPAVIGPLPHGKFTAPGPAINKPQKSSGWPWRRSLSRPPSADGSKPMPSAASMTAAVPIASETRHLAPADPLARALIAMPSGSPEDGHLPEAGQVDDAAAQAHDEDAGDKTPASGRAGVTDDDVASPGAEAVAGGTRGAAEAEPLHPETGLTLTQHQQLLDEGHFGGWSCTSGVIKRERAQRTKSTDPGAALPRQGSQGWLGSRQNSRDLGLAGSSPERRSFFGIRHTHAPSMGSSPPIGAPNQGRSQATPTHSPIKPGASSQSSLAPPPLHPLPFAVRTLASNDQEQHVDESNQAETHATSPAALAKKPAPGQASEDLAPLPTPSTSPMYEAQSQPTLLSPFSSPATQDASQDGLANAEDGVGIVGGVYGVTTPHKSKEQPPGLGREQETGSGRLQAADNALEAQEVSARTPSSGSSGEGSRRSRSSFTRSVAKLGREALENLADLQTAAQRAISGPRSKEEPSLPHSFNPLESGARAATRDPLQHPSPTSQPVNDTPGPSFPDSSGLVGHLSQAISEHVACATGGSGQATTPADVSPQDFNHSDSGTSSLTSEDAHATLKNSSAMQQHDSPPATVQPGAFQQHADEPLLQNPPAGNEYTGHADIDIGQQVHQRPVMEAPSSKRHKIAEPSSVADTSSSELNLADFGLSSTPVWQGTPDEQQTNNGDP